MKVLNRIMELLIVLSDILVIYYLGNSVVGIIAYTLLCMFALVSIFRLELRDIDFTGANIINCDSLETAKKVAEKLSEKGEKK